MITLTAITLVFGTGWVVKKAWEAAVAELTAAAEAKPVRGEPIR